MTITRRHVDALRELIEAAEQGRPPILGETLLAINVVDELAYRIDMDESVPEFPTNTEVEDMARKAGLDEVPF